MSVSFTGPYPVSAAVERLRTHVPELRLVGRAAELQAAIAQPPQVTAAAFVVATERGRQAKLGTGLFVQHLDVMLGVLVYARNYAGQRGEQATSEMEALSRQVRLALAGWTPIRQATALELHSEAPEQFAGGQLWHQIVFRTNYRIKVSPQ